MKVALRLASSMRMLRRDYLLIASLVGTGLLIVRLMLMQF